MCLECPLIKFLGHFFKIFSLANSFLRPSSSNILEKTARAGSSTTYNSYRAGHFYVLTDLKFHGFFPHTCILPYFIFVSLNTCVKPPNYHFLTIRLSSVHYWNVPSTRNALLQNFPRSLCSTSTHYSM